MQSSYMYPISFCVSHVWDCVNRHCSICSLSEIQYNLNPPQVEHKSEVYSKFSLEALTWQGKAEIRAIC